MGTIKKAEVKTKQTLPKKKTPKKVTPKKAAPKKATAKKVTPKKVALKKQETKRKTPEKKPRVAIQKKLATPVAQVTEEPSPLDSSSVVLRKPLSLDAAPVAVVRKPSATTASTASTPVKAIDLPKAKVDVVSAGRDCDDCTSVACQFGCVASEQGRRPTMEDTHVALQNDVFTFYGVFDGHGGTRAAKILAAELPPHAMNRLMSAKTATPDLFRNQTKLTKALGDIYEEFDRGLCLREKQSGSTAIVVIRHANDLFFVNLGDSRAILIDDANASVVYATKDQKPNNEEERKRIQDAGGLVMGGRVYGMLAVARAFGDDGLKRNGAGGKSPETYAGKDSWVSPIPVVDIVRLVPGKKYHLVLACDGLWDVFSNTDVARIVVIDKLRCKALVDRALQMPMQQDNVTAMIVPLCVK